MADFQSDTGNVFYFEDTGVIYTSGYNPLAKAYVSEDASEDNNSNRPAKAPSEPLVTDPETDQTISYWGGDNLRPQNMYQKGRKSPVLTSTIQALANTMSAGRVQYGKRIIDSNGKEHFEQKNIPEIEEFITRSQIQTRFLNRIYSDMYWYYNMFPELILNKSSGQHIQYGNVNLSLPKSKIVGITIQDAQYCRWSLQDKKGRIHTCYINAQWETAQPSDKETIKVPVIDTAFDPVYWLKTKVLRSAHRKFIYPLAYYTPGKTFYQEPAWTSVLNGWLDVALAIPEFKKAVMENSIAPKFHIKIADWYWEQKYKDWNEKPEEQQLELRRKEIETFNQTLAGQKNAGRSIMTEFYSDKHSGKEVHGWHIDPLDTKNFADGIYLDDGEAANLHLMYALNYPSGLSGNSLTKSASVAGGSEVHKRFNTFLIQSSIHHRIAMETLDFISRYNNWDVEFRQERPFMQALSNTTPAQREAVFDSNTSQNLSQNLF